MGREIWLDDEVYFNSIVNRTVKKYRKKLGSDFIQNLSTFSELNINSFGMLAEKIQDPNLEEDSRLVLCWIAGKLGDKRISPYIINLFYEESNKLAWQVAQTLRLLESKKVIIPLIEILKKMEPFEKRKAAAYALGAIPDTNSIEALTYTLLNKSEHSSVRGQAAESLALIGTGHYRVILALLANLSDAEVEVRFWSLYSLGQLASKETIPVIEKLTADKNVLSGWWSIGEEAKSAIEKIAARG